MELEMELKQKRGRRGNNYTNIEKQILIELTDQYKDIIVNKEFNSTWIRKKRAAWDEITQRYNNAQSSGARTWKQLRHWYDNHKHYSRKTQCTYTTDNGYLPIVNAEPTRLFEIKIEEDRESSEHSNSNEQSTNDHSNEQNRKNHRIESAKEQYYRQSTNSLSNGQDIDNHRVESIKEQYYRTKLKNARLETRFLVNKNKMEISRHRKEMEILRLKLKILEGRNRKH